MNHIVRDRERSEIFMKAFENDFLPVNAPQEMTCEKSKTSAVSTITGHSPTSSGEVLSCGTKACLRIECVVSAFGLGSRESRLLTLDMTFRQEAGLDGVLIILYIMVGCL